MRKNCLLLFPLIYCLGVAAQAPVAGGEQRLNYFARTDVSDALGFLPGVNVTAVGPRGESAVYVRGFDLRQTPLLLDGIPIYVPIRSRGGTILFPCGTGIKL